MPKPWEKAPERSRKSGKLKMFVQLFVAYIAYLAIWKCPVTQPLTCNCPPCETLHSVYDNHVAPLWTEYGQPYYEKIEPHSAPLLAKLEPVYTHVHTTLKGHVEPHYHQFKSTLGPRLEPFLPHWTALKAQITKYYALLEPHGKKLLANLKVHLQVAYAKLVELYFAHVAPKLSVYLRELDRQQVELVGKVSDWANTKYHDALNHAHGWLSDKIQNTVNKTVTAASATTETGTASVSTTTAMSATTTTEQTGTAAEATIPADAQEADDYIQNSGSSSSSISKGSIPVTEPGSAKPKVAKAPGPVVHKLKKQEEPKHDGEEVIEDFHAKAQQVLQEDHEEPAVHTPKEASKKDSAKAKLSWSARVARTAKSANKNLDVDSKEYQEKIIEEAKPGIMKKLRDLSAYGEEKVKSLSTLVTDVEDDKAKFDDDAEIYDQFDEAAQHLQGLMMGVRADCESLAQNVIDKTSEYRKEALESLDDFFDIVLAEAGKDAAGNDDDDDWERWQSYSKLKKQLVTVRKEVEEYEPDMETVNTALRESQQAAILLTQEFIQHLKTMRARAQFHIQQNALLEAKKNQDQEVDADWVVIDEQEAQKNAQQYEQQPIGDRDPVVPEEVEEERVRILPIDEEEPEIIDLEVPDLVDDTFSEPESDVETLVGDDMDDEEEDQTETLILTETIYQTRINTHSSI